MEVPSDVSAYDIDWFAVDQFGYLAHFASGGVAPIPLAAGKTLEEFSEVSQLVRVRLPIAGRARVEKHRREIQKATKIAAEWMPTPSEDEMHFAKQGLFCYQAPLLSDVGQPYIRVAVPSHPMMCGDLDQSLATLLGRVLIRLEFAHSIVIKAQSIPV